MSLSTYSETVHSMRTIKDTFKIMKWLLNPNIILNILEYLEGVCEFFFSELILIDEIFCEIYKIFYRFSIKWFNYSKQNSLSIYVNGIKYKSRISKW